MINILEADYGIRLDEILKRGRQRLYRYVDTNYTLPLFRMNDRDRNKIQDAIYVLKDFEGEPIDTLIEKGVDVSAVYDGVSISFKRKIKLNANKNKIILA